MRLSTALPSTGAQARACTKKPWARDRNTSATSKVANLIPVASPRGATRYLPDTVHSVKLGGLFLRCQFQPQSGIAMIYQNILETIGRTPIVRINRLAPKGVDMYVKVEA